MATRVRRMLGGQPTFEEIEGRVLYSADGLGAIDPDLIRESDEVVVEAGLLPTRDDGKTAVDERDTVAAIHDREARSEVVFVDPTVPDSQALLDDLSARAGSGEHLEVVVLDPREDGIAQISRILEARQGVDTVHIVAHGRDGAVALGGSVLDLDALEARAEEIRGWGRALDTTADVLVYGCDLAASDTGRAMIDAFGRLTGADVAASKDLTGAAILGGDWDLEYQVGSIESTLAFTSQIQHGWGGVLADTENALWITEKSSLPVEKFEPSTLEPTSGVTSGSFAAGFDIQNFTGTPKEIWASHYVTGSVTIGSGTTFTVQPGDLLMSIAGAANLDGTGGADISVNKGDVFVFRPDTAGDYSAGGFYMLLEGLGGSNELLGLSLVEQDITVGGQFLAEGSFLYSSKDGSGNKKIHNVAVTDAGTTTTLGPPTLFLDGLAAGVNLGQEISGLQLVQSDLTLGDTNLTAGQLLMSLVSSDDVGNNLVTAQKTDIFILDITSSTLADATLLFEGVESGGVVDDVRSIAIFTGDGNEAPVGLPTVTGTPTEDQILTADTAGISDADGLGPFSYQWLRDGADIGGATSSTYTLGDVDVGAQVSVRVSYTDGQGTLESVTSAGTAAVTNVNDAPSLHGWFGAGWAERKAITLGAAGVVEDVTDFPVLVRIAADANLAALAQTDGDDIVFTAADGVTKLAHEIQSYDFATGELVAWVKTDLSASTDTQIYLYYGNAAVSSQQDAANVWDDDYVGVWHLEEAPTGALGEIRDSTANANHGATEGAMDAADSVAGRIGQALDFDEVDDLIRIPDSATLDGTAAAATIEVWLQWDDADDGDHQIIMTSSNRFTSGAKDGYEWASQGDGDHFFYPWGGADPNYVLGANPFANGTWHHVAVTMEHATRDVEIYVDGSPMSFTQDTLPTTWTSLADPADWLWGGNPDRPDRYFDGLMDEIRVSDAVRSQGWLQTSINNQANPGAFVTVGAVEPRDFHLTPIDEDDSASAGDTVASLIANAGADRILDPDAGAVEGLAVVAVDDSNGTWQYDAGSGWTDFGTPSDSAAVLLDAAARVRFVPDPDFNGSAGLTFRAWDATDGNASGATGIDVSANGADTAYSTDTGLAVLDVNPVNDDPTFGLLGGGPTFVEDGPAVVLDGDVTVFDAELSAADDFAGATLTLARNGGASAEDLFSAAGNLAALTEGANLTLSGVDIGTVTTNTAGQLVLTFNASATQARVDETLQSIAYANSSDAPPASVQIDWIFDDGNAGAQGAGGALQANGSTTVAITATDDAPTGAPTVTGTASEGAVLTADTSGIADPDGLGTFSYQWLRDGSTVSGATASTYTLGAADVGARMSVEVSYTDAGGSGEGPLVSAQTTVVTAGPAANDAYDVSEDAPLVTDAISGWQHRIRLSFDNTGQSVDLDDFPVLVKLDATRIDYAQTQDAGEDLRFYDADGVTLLAHEIERWDEAGTSYVWVRVPRIDAGSGTDYIYMDYGNAAAPDGQNAAAVWSSGYRGVYHLAGDPGAAGAVTDSAGLNPGVNAGSADGAGVIGDGQDFDGASDYVDLGQNRDFINNATEVTVSAWINPDTTAGTGDILGVTVDGAVDTGASRAAIIRNGDDVQVIARTDDGGSDTINLYTNTSPLTAGSWHYVTATIDYASDVDNVKIYVDGNLEGTFSHDFALNAIPSTNSTNAAIGTDEDGGMPWFDGQIDEARIAVVARSADWVAAQHLSMTDSFVTFGATQRSDGVLANDIDPEGDTLTVSEVNGSAANVGSTITIGSGALLTVNADGSFTYDPNGQFEHLGAGDTASDSFSYTSDDGNGNTATATVTITVNGANDAPTGIPAVTGTPTEDQTLSADTSGISDAEGLGAFSYQWLRNGSAIGGATSSSYTLGDADVGQQLSVRVSYTDGRGASESVTSLQVGPIANVNDAGAVGIDNATPAQGDTLTASVSDDDGVSGAIGYQWQRDGVNIGGATSSTYTTTQADVGAVMTVVTSYTDDEGTPESVTSAQTAPVANLNNPAVGAPTIAGTAAEDQVLAADTSGISDADGLGPFSYQWLRDGSAVGGATSSTYTLGDADVGRSISVEVSYADGNGTPEGPLTSGQTAPVANVDDALTGAPTIAGSAVEGQTLVADTGAIADADGLGTFGFQWLRDGVAVAGATGQSYALTAADTGAQISVRVDHVDARGAAESAVSAPTGPVVAFEEGAQSAGVEDPESETVTVWQAPAEDPTESQGLAGPERDASSGPTGSGSAPPPSLEVPERQAVPTFEPSESVAPAPDRDGRSQQEGPATRPRAISLALWEVLWTAETVTTELALDTSLINPELADRAAETAFRAALREMREEVEDAAREDNLPARALEAALQAAGSSTAAGSVWWLLRGSSLFASVLTTLPAWRGFDPLPVLEAAPPRKGRDEEKADEDDSEAGAGRVLDSLGDTAERGSERATGDLTEVRA